MPYYEYYCPSNGRTVEVRHGMAERLTTWGELASRLGGSVDETPAEAPVERVLSITSPTPGGSRTGPSAGCGMGCACAPQ